MDAVILVDIGCTEGVVVLIVADPVCANVVVFEVVSTPGLVVVLLVVKSVCMDVVLGLAVLVNPMGDVLVAIEPVCAYVVVMVCVDCSDNIVGVEADCSEEIVVLVTIEAVWEDAVVAKVDCSEGMVAGPVCVDAVVVVNVVCSEVVFELVVVGPVGVVAGSVVEVDFSEPFVVLVAVDSVCANVVIVFAVVSTAGLIVLLLAVDPVSVDTVVAVLEDDWSAEFELAVLGFTDDNNDVDSPLVEELRRTLVKVVPVERVSDRVDSGVDKISVGIEVSASDNVVAALVVNDSGTDLVEDDAVISGVVLSTITVDEVTEEL